MSRSEGRAWSWRRLLGSWRSPPRGARQATGIGPAPPHASLVAEADAHRDASAFAQAAIAYGRALALAPDRDDLRVQLANMLKDSGQFDAAEAAYREALIRTDAADTHLQLGHVLKRTGRREAALDSYRAALARDPGLTGAAHELAEAGDAVAGRRLAEAELRAGGAEALLVLGDAVARMRDDLDRIARLLPDVRARTAFPPALWDTFRGLFPVPAPPEGVSSPIAVVLAADDADLATLFAQIGAVQAQAWPRWTLWVAGGGEGARRAVELAAVADPRVRWVPVPPGTPPSSAEGVGAAAALQAGADLLLLTGAGAVPEPQALAWFAFAFRETGADALVCDEETAERHGTVLARSAPVLRGPPDFDSLLERDTCGHTVAMRAGAYRDAPPGLPDGLAARRAALLLPLVAAGRVGHVPQPLVWRRAGPTLPDGDRAAGVDASLGRAGLGGRIAFPPDARPVWRAERPEAPIAVVIATRDNAADLRAMVDSLRATAARPEALDLVVVDNGTTRPDDVATLRTLAQDGVRVLPRPGAFAWSHFNGEAATAAAAPLVVFANDDMRMRTGGWDMRLRGLLERPDVGVVGARLLYPDDTVQHAGVLLGWKGSVIHDGLFATLDDAGPNGRWHTTRAVSAVTGAFLAVRRDLFLSLGGFDTGLPVAYSDIDFCLRVRGAGLKVLWTPAITLDHHESKSRGLDHVDAWRLARNAQERAVMEARWGSALATDPLLHPAWCDATLPFRLLAAPSVAACRAYMAGTGAAAAPVT